MTKKLKIDIGYSTTKIEWNNELYKFPSAVAPVKLAMANINDVTSYELDGRKYLVGNEAVKESFTTRGYDYLGKYGVVLLHRALDMLNIEITDDLEIVTGLSLLNWNHAQDFGASLRRKVNGKALTSSNKITVKPQGLIKVKDTVGTSILINIGYYSVDVVILENGVADRANSYALDIGINWIVQELKKLLNTKFDLNYNELQANDILQRGSINMGGVEKSLDIEIDELKHNYSQVLLPELVSKNNQLWKTANRIVFSGGGVHYLELPQQPNIITDSNCEYADVKSF